MKISCSARKDWQFHIRDWIDLGISHAKIHGDLIYGYKDIDYIFGFPEGTAPLFGGRVVEEFITITKMDIYWGYNHGIGLKLALSSKSFSEDMYRDTKLVLKEYHRKGNAVIVSTDKLARRIREDFPDYKIEASAVMDITDTNQLNKKAVTGLYDTIVLPMCANDDMSFLESIENKEQIRLFLNVECSYNCPSKVCYGATSKMNNNARKEPMICSHYDLKMPRTWYNNSVKWDEFYFDVSKLDAMGFSKYKLVPPWESQQRTRIMTDEQYKEKA